MKRLLLLTCAIGLLTFASCERRDVATAILTVGFSSANVEPVEDDWASGLTPETNRIEATGPKSKTPVDLTWEDLQEMRETLASGVALEAEQIDALLARIDAVIESSSGGNRSNGQLRMAQDAKLTALSIGANAFPEVYAKRRDDYYRNVFQAEYDQQTAERASVKQFVESHLSKSLVGPETTAALARHVTAYPHCDLNVQLYMTTVERLANEDEIGAAVRVGTEGAKLCASHSSVAQLKSQVKKLRMANPDAPGTTMQFTSPTLRGQRFDLRSFRGKPVLVVFWATWCEACVQDQPYIIDFYKRFRGDGLEVVGVSLDVDRQALADFVNENQMPWPQMFSNHPGNEAWDNPIAKHYKVQSIPDVFLLDENGVIVASHLRSRYAIEEAILNYLSR